MSVDKPVTFSVPQGSVVGPILFNYYVGSLPDCIKHDRVLINRFADDHTLHNSYQVGDISAETNSIRTLEDSLHSVNDWMGQNKLHMSPSKMEYISFESKTMIKRATVTNITVCNDTVICSPCIKLLGSYLDQSLTMSTHIMKKCSLAMWNLSCIQSIKNYMDTDSLKTTVQALCISHLDYSNALRDPPVHQWEQITDARTTITDNTNLLHKANQAKTSVEFVSTCICTCKYKKINSIFSFLG